MDCKQRFLSVCSWIATSLERTALTQFWRGRSRTGSNLPESAIYISPKTKLLHVPDRTGGGRSIINSSKLNLREPSSTSFHLCQKNKIEPSSTCQKDPKRFFISTLLTIMVSYSVASGVGFGGTRVTLLGSDVSSVHWLPAVGDSAALQSMTESIRQSSMSCPDFLEPHLVPIALAASN